MASQDESRSTADDEVVREPDADDLSSQSLHAWALRPLVLFAAGYTIIGILHEWAHALTAYALKVPSTLFHLYVSLDRANGTLNQRAVIRVAGPLFCLIVGVVCWFVYRKLKGGRAELPLLYLAWFGAGTFFGNLMSTPFVGDFSDLSRALQLSTPARYVAGLVGLLTLCALSFLMGRELSKFAPKEVGAFKATMGLIAIPAIVGTAIVILIFLPMPAGFGPARVGESAFWIFAAVGTFISRKHVAARTRDLGVGWVDFAVLGIAVVVVRIMAGGIAFAP
jgi:hypothetical protein